MKCSFVLVNCVHSGAIAMQHCIDFSDFVPRSFGNEFQLKLTSNFVVYIKPYYLCAIDFFHKRETFAEI